MPSTSIGAAIGLALGAYGKKPKVPELTPVSPDATQKATVAGNAANFGDIAKLAANVNTFNQDQLNALIDRVLPGARQQIQSNISSQLRGEIPQDVQNAIYRGVAERSAGGNAFGGGGFTRNVTARDLGLTSLDITNKALSSAEYWLSKATAPTFDVTSMFFTPQQRLAQENLQQERQYQRDSIAAGVAAAPDPGMAALAQGIDSDFARVENAALTYAGGLSSSTAKQPEPMNGGLAASNQSFGVSNPYSLGGYSYGSQPGTFGFGR